MINVPFRSTNILTKNGRKKLESSGCEYEVYSEQKFASLLPKATTKVLYFLRLRARDKI